MSLYVLHVVSISRLKVHNTTTEKQAWFFNFVFSAWQRFAHTYPNTLTKPEEVKPKITFDNACLLK